MRNPGTLREVEDWTSDPADTTTSDGPAPCSPTKSNTPDQTIVAEENEKDNPKTEPEKTPRIRLKTNLATDPALHPHPPATPSLSNLKTEIEASQSPSEYLAVLPPAIQSALVSRGFFLPNLIPGPEVVPRQADCVESRQPSVPIFQCSPCGIRFSSLSTLEAHQTYYCSHRVTKSSNDDDSKSTGAEPSGNQSDIDLSEPSAKTIRTGKQYTCNQCSYSADKKVSLNRHMRMHTVSPSPSPLNSATAIPNGEQNTESQDRYCTDCDIRFSSQKTFRAHKTHYCNSRHMVKSTSMPPATKTTSSCTSSSSPTSPVDTASCRTPPSPAPAPQVPPQQPFLALPTNPIIIVPYSLFRSASVLPNLSSAAGLPNPDMPCFLLPNGTFQPMTSSITPNPSNQQSEVLKTTNKPKESSVIREITSAPLDLSVRKSPEPKDLVIDLGDEQEKKIVKRSPTPERIECVPSLHSSPSFTPMSQIGASPSVSVSPKRKHEETSRTNSPKQSRQIPKTTSDVEKASTSPAPQFDIPPSLHPLLMRAGTLPLFPPEVQMRLSDMPALPPVVPQFLVKQGASKCKGCNIVFCNQENYLAHKKHYCSARNLEEDASKTSGSPPVSPRSTGTISPAGGQYQQLICLACGIKFTSLDNLNAHQAYYCLKRNEMDLRKCGKCRGLAEPGHQCVPHATLAGWKCPCCDVISSTASAAQRHMDSHTGVKAYRCTICKYKGNTLRGMRTHIRMHFDKRSPDLQEEKYISYILEDESSNMMEVNVSSTAGPTLLDDRSVSPSSEGHLDTLHHCPQCSYSSAYKANVLRHIRLVHEVSPVDDGVVNGSDDKTVRSMPVLEEDEEIMVKKEAIEPEVIIAPLDEPVIKEEVFDHSITSKLKSVEEEILPETSKPGTKYCKSCDISFTYYKTFVAHKKFYCSSHAGEMTAASANNNNNPTTHAAETSVL
ncbi:hypothetical protein NQ315_010823 [Exocentrus adspersus]|uniref:Zinc finger protein ush n=1 Tax=Exocentrus adspersus TaxID=1586481 RepID=A0AAV8V9V8_9CUCU|nr:hypothetical protein NQ315_010823 [Exocentrus adspersus]